MLDAALGYAAKGWPVFPLKPREKVPATAHGVKDATTDEATIRRWWAKWPDANVGYATGNGVAVVDIDNLGSWTDLLEEAQVPVPDTSRVETSRGWQLYFRTDAAIRNSAGTLKPGLDVRGAGGYVVLPPSVHPSGHVYRWGRNGTPDEIPSWLLERLTATPPVPHLPPAPRKSLIGITNYGHAALEAEIAIVAGAVEGTRRDRLNTAALKLGGLIAGGALDEHDVRAELRAAALSTGLPETEIDDTIGNGIADGRTQPRQAPELARFDLVPPVSELVAEAATTPDEQHPDGPVFTDLRDIQVRDVRWLEEQYLPEGELVTNNADGGTGKGLLSVHYGTRMSLGEYGGTPRMVVYAVAEDAYETILKPRLLAAGADLAYVRGLDWRRRGMKDAVVIPDDIPRLEQSVREMGVGLLVIDPLLSHLSSKTNSHVDHEVKVALKPLVALAQGTGCTVLGNGHFGKDKTRGAIGSAQGSNAFTNTPRVALGMAPDDDDDDVRILEVIKSNLGAKGVGRNYRITTVDVDGLGKPVPLIVPEGAATKRIDTLLLAKKDEKRVPAELLQSIVLRELAHGEQTRQHLDQAAKAETGANPDSVYKSALKPLRERDQIRARKDGMVGGWFWRLANSDERPPSKMDVEDG